MKHIPGIINPADDLIKPLGDMYYYYTQGMPDIHNGASKTDKTPLSSDEIGNVWKEARKRTYGRNTILLLLQNLFPQKPETRLFF